MNWLCVSSHIYNNLKLLVIHYFHNTNKIKYGPGFERSDLYVCPPKKKINLNIALRIEQY